MSVTVVKNLFKGVDNFTVFEGIQSWVAAQIPELKLFKSDTKSHNSAWWLYRFGDTDYGVAFHCRTYGVHYFCGASFYRGISDSVSIKNEYEFEFETIMENDKKLYVKGAIVVRTPHGVIIQWMTSAGMPFANFLYFGKANSAVNGEVTVGGIFSAASFIYSSTDSESQYKSDVSYFYFKIDSETPAVWRHGVLTAILPGGASHGVAGSIVASAVYGVTSTIWTDPIRIDAFYSLAGPVSPPYYTGVTVGGRKMQRVGEVLLLEG